MESEAEMRGEHIKVLKAAKSSRKGFHAEAHKHLTAASGKTAVQAFALGNLPSGSDDGSAEPGTLAEDV